MSIARAVAVFATMIAAAAAAWLFVREIGKAGNAADALIAWLPHGALLAGAGGAVALVGMGWRRREGFAPHCACCGYERNEGERLIVCCPECGSPWRWIGWTVQGRPVSRPALLAGGVFLGVLTLAASLAWAAAPRLIHRTMPERLLVLHAAAAPWYANLDGWREIRQRRLSTQNEIWLASQLLDRERRNRPLPHDALVWLNDLKQAGKLPGAWTPPRLAQSPGF